MGAGHLAEPGGGRDEGWGNAIFQNSTFIGEWIKRMRDLGLVPDFYIFDEFETEDFVFLGAKIWCSVRCYSRRPLAETEASTPKYWVRCVRVRERRSTKIGY